MYVFVFVFVCERACVHFCVCVRVRVYSWCRSLCVSTHVVFLVCTIVFPSGEVSMLVKTAHVLGGECNELMQNKCLFLSEQFSRIVHFVIQAQ